MKEATAGMRSGFGMGMGYGAMGPGQQGQKRNYSNFGGGYPRPPKNKKYWEIDINFLIFSDHYLGKPSEKKNCIF